MEFLGMTVEYVFQFPWHDLGISVECAGNSIFNRFSGCAALRISIAVFFQRPQYDPNRPRDDPKQPTNCQRQSRSANSIVSGKAAQLSAAKPLNYNIASGKAAQHMHIQMCKTTSRLA